MWSILIEQMKYSNRTGHGVRAGELISQKFLIELLWTLFFEPVNITAFTNFNCFVFPKSLYIFEGQYCKLVVGRKSVLYAQYIGSAQLCLK